MANLLIGLRELRLQSLALRLCFDGCKEHELVALHKYIAEGWRVREDVVQLVKTIQPACASVKYEAVSSCNCPHQTVQAEAMMASPSFGVCRSFSSLPYGVSKLGLKTDGGLYVCSIWLISSSRMLIRRLVTLPSSST